MKQLPSGIKYTRSQWKALELCEKPNLILDLTLIDYNWLRYFLSQSLGVEIRNDIKFPIRVSLSSIKYLGSNVLMIDMFFYMFFTLVNNNSFP